MKNKSFGNVLLEARQRKKISQDALSQKLHISRQSISNWENNYSLPDFEMLKEICHILNMNYDEISKMDDFSNKYEVKNDKKGKIIILLILVIVFLTILNFSLIFFRTKMVVYDVFIEDNDKVTLNNGIFINTNSNSYFRLGTIKLNNDDINNYRVRVYFKTDDGVHLLIESNYNENIFIRDSDLHEEYFKNDIKKLSFYIDLISLKDSKITYSFNLEFQINFSNDNILNFETFKKSKKESESKTYQEIMIDEKIFKNNNYKSTFGKYTKEVQNGTFQYDPFLNALSYFDDTINLEYKFMYKVFYGTEYDYNNQVFSINFTFDEENQQLMCYSDTCDNYKDYVKILKEEIDSLTE